MNHWLLAIFLTMRLSLMIDRTILHCQVEMFGVTQKGRGDDLLAEFLEIEKQLFINLGLHFR